MADSTGNALNAAVAQGYNPDPTQFIGKWQGVQKNALEIQQAQAQQAQGEAALAAIDENGNFNQATYLQNLRNDPRTARGAIAAAQGGITLDTATYDLHSKRLDAVMSGAGQLIADNPSGIPGDKLSAYLDQQHKVGNLSNQEYAAANSQVSSTPLANSQFVLQGMGHALQAKTALDAAKPAPSVQNVGSQLVTVQPSGQSASSPTPSVQQGTGGVGLGMSPDSTAEYQRWLKSPRDYPDPSNPTVTKHGTNETYLVDTGVPRQYIYPGGAPATPGTQPSPLGTGRLPPALTNPNKPQTAPAAPAASPAGTGIQGPTPAQTAGATATVEQGKLGPPQFQAEATADTQAQNQQAILGNMLSDTSQFTTGPLAGIVGKVRNLAGNFGLPINTEGQSAKESFNKLAAGLANAQGSGSDARMSVNISANPHEELSPAGVDLILRQLQGNADYIRARASLAAKYPDKSDYPGFQQSIKGLDPRVFQMARMTADQRANYWKSLDSEARKQIDAAGKAASQLGVLGG